MKLKESEIIAIATFMREKDIEKVKQRLKIQF